MKRWMRAGGAVTLAVSLMGGSGALAGDAAHGGHAPASRMTAGASPGGVTLEPGRGSELGAAFEAFLSPHQESDEEENTPGGVPKMFRATAPSLSRAQREAAGHRGHGVLRFRKDLSRAYVDVKIEGIRPKDINMFHIHCGKPGILGPIVVDFSLITNVQENLADGVFSVEITNEAIVKNTESGHGPIGAFTAGCFILSPTLEGLKPARVSTVAGLAVLAQQGELYFNVHTYGNTYYGDIRGQIMAPGGTSPTAAATPAAAPSR